MELWVKDVNLDKIRGLLEFILHPMLNSGKKFRALRDKKNKYSNSCLVREKNF